MQIMSKIRPTHNSKKCIGTNIRLHITGNTSLPRTYSQKKSLARTSRSATKVEMGA